MDLENDNNYGLSLDYDSLHKQLEGLPYYKKGFNKYDVFCFNEEKELNELHFYENEIKKSYNYFRHFENIHKNIKRIYELDEDTKEKILETNEMTYEILDEIHKLKKEQYDIRVKEKMYNKILEEYSLSPLSYSNLTDLKISLNIEFFEHLKQFEYIKENIIKLLNEDGSQKLCNFYTKHYNKIMIIACRKISIYIIKENNNFYRRNNKIVNLLFCNINEEFVKREKMILLYIKNLLPITKLSYKIIIENIEYFNLCLNNFLNLRKKYLKINYQNYMSNNYKSINKKNSLDIIEPREKHDFIKMFKNFFLFLYYFIILEDNFLKIFFSFNFYFTNEIIPYISANIDNVHNNIYNIIDTLFIPYKYFLDTNLNIYSKCYESCYELFHILNIFILKLKQFQNNDEINDIIKNIIIKYAQRNNDTYDALICYNLSKSKLYLPNKISNNNNNMKEENIKMDINAKKENDMNNISDNNLNGTYQNIGDVKNNYDLDKNLEKLDNNKKQTKKKTQDGQISEVRIDSSYMNEDSNKFIEDRQMNVTKNNLHSEEYISNNNDKPTLDVKDGDNIEFYNKSNEENVSENNDEKYDKIVDMQKEDNIPSHNSSKNKSSYYLDNIKEKYNSKILNYTLKIQKNIENEFISIWQRDVVSFYLNKINKNENTNSFEDTLFYVKKILYSLKNVYSIYKMYTLYGKDMKEQNFQNVLDITINPLINNCLKNQNSLVHNHYIFIVNMFTFIQDSIKNIEGASKYCELLTIIIDENINKLLKIELENLKIKLELDKLEKIDQENIKEDTEELKAFVDNFYKFVFSEKYNIFLTIHKILSDIIKDNIKNKLFEYIHKEYILLYEKHSNKFKFNYTPEQIKCILYNKC
ncbi:conserved Plasmodium protein, unknown function [Plasmodium sp. gorilla clade G2]|uniref:conserved Plasmodium protein, unknown function n=1 Tax=Plasmodium sp. gorilla clade G2 TaxID=880535 RepID=UPI000D206916|nr:conserved Plasmodium protein, unknown function [Plasmodium sp. gorilla clade G2]SOV19792.1 conserved Plasmodium protein, unknown function [Plasmodium sp. gorilla clade G2]